MQGTPPWYKFQMILLWIKFNFELQFYVKGMGIIYSEQCLSKTFKNYYIVISKNNQVLLTKESYGSAPQNGKL